MLVIKKNEMFLNSFELVCYTLFNFYYNLKVFEWTSTESIAIAY